DGREARVARHDAHVERLEAEDLGDARGEDVVAPLADLGRAAERRHLARTVEPELDARVRHVVPVDRKAGAAEIRRAGEPEPAPERQLPAARLPARALDDLVDAGAEVHGGDPEPVRRDRVRRRELLPAELGRVEPERARDLVEL